jgi:hypothetical protein
MIYQNDNGILTQINLKTKNFHNKIKLLIDKKESGQKGAVDEDVAGLQGLPAGQGTARCFLP